MEIGESVKVGGAADGARAEDTEERKKSLALRVVKVLGPTRVEEGQAARYKVVAFNRLATSEEKNRVQWEVRIAGEAVAIGDPGERQGDTLVIARVPEEHAGVQWLDRTLRIYAYLEAPTERASADVDVHRMSYLDYIRHEIDTGTTDIDEIFTRVCRRYGRHSGAWSALDDIDEIWGALWDLLGTNLAQLSAADKPRWLLVNAALKKGKKFNGQMDKLQHFIAGGGVAAAAGEGAGWSASWLVEKYDSLKRLWGDLWGTRLPHQIGFDWDDLQFTAAGSSFENFFDDLSEDRCKSLIAAFATGALAFSTVFTPDPTLQGGFGEFSPLISPFARTNIDRVDEGIAKMKERLERHVQGSLPSGQESPAGPRRRKAGKAHRLGLRRARIAKH